MKPMFVLSVLVCMCLTTGGAAFAGHGHYLNGMEGIGAASLPPEGFYYKMYNAFYTASQYRDDRSKLARGDFNVDVLVNAHRFIYSSPVEFLGGNLVADLIVPLVYTGIYNKVGGTELMDDYRFSLGDVLVEPLILAWHGERWDAVAGISVYIPTGYYRANRPADPGKGFWTFMGSLGGTVYLDQEKTWSASVLARYEIHTEQWETRTTPGHDFHFEWGLGKTINKIFTVGLAGYCGWQVTRDSGNSVKTDYREQLMGVGPEIGFSIPDWNLQVSLRVLFEFANRNAPQGIFTNLSLTKSF